MRPICVAMAVTCFLTVAPVQADRPPQPDARGSGRQGAAPPTALGDEQRATLQRILAPYKPLSLTADDVLRIRRALDEAGLRSGRALDTALTQQGFSRKRMETLLPAQTLSTDGPASHAGRVLPRRQ